VCGELIVFKLAIIIPIYKVKSFINECVDSLVLEYDKNFQYVFVDDGCPENSLEFAKSKNDDFFNKNNVVIVKKKNGGISSARNAGLDKVNAEFFTFLDPDDFYCDGFRAVVNEAILNYDFDILEYEMVRFKNKATYPSIVNRNIDVVFSGCSSQIRNKSLGRGDWQVWRRVFKSERYLTHRFIEGVCFSEDISYTSPMYYENFKLMVLSNRVIAYRDNSGSITAEFSNLPTNRVQIYLESFKKIICDFDRGQVVDYRIIDSVLLIAARLGLENPVVLSEKRLSVLSIELLKRIVFSIRYVTGNKKYYRIIFIFSPFIYVHIRRWTGLIKRTSRFAKLKLNNRL
jgi:glycosyltransferase involved in cell wall biosynthesis